MHAQRSAPDDQHIDVNRAKVFC
jgi:hypothetical protein